MSTLNSPESPPPPWETVLLLHWYDDSDREPLCETGYLHPEHGYVWHNASYSTDDVPVMAWMPLPLIPERP